MNFSRPFIERPVATTVIMVALVIFGWLAYRMLPISELPNVDFPTIVVSASLPGADPETMASTIATPLEKQLSTIPNVDSMSSVSNTGQTRITLQFSLDRDIDAAAQDVQSAIALVAKRLPPQMTSPPTFKKVNPAQAGVLYLALTSDYIPLSKLDDYAETYIGQQLSTVSGVAQVNVYGSQQYAVRLMLNPNALATRGLDVASVVSTIKSLSVSQPTGILQSQGYSHALKADGQLNNAKEFNDTIITVVNGAPVHLKDVGYALDSVANDKVATWYNQKRSIMLEVQRQPGTNTVAIVNDINRLLPTIIKKLPGDAKLHVLYDRSVFIKASLHEVQFTLLLAIILVIIITYFFLGSLSSTLITLLDFPVSIVATFGVMYLLNYSLDNLSLMGLVLAVGFVIDDTIVVLENILQHLERGVDRLTAAIKATEEISFTVISMTLSLVAVFIPILFLGGILGRLFHEFAVVVGTAILFSGIIALTFTPMLRSRLLASNHIKQQNNILKIFTLGFEYSRRFYLKTLKTVLDYQKVMLCSLVGILVITGFLFYFIPKGFIPTEDIALILSTTQVREGLNFSDFVARQRQVMNVILKNSNVEAISSTVGQSSGGVSAGNTGQIIIRLKPRKERSLAADQVIQALRLELAKVPGISIFLQNPPVIRIGGMSSAGNYQYVLQGSHWQPLQRYSLLLQQKIAEIPGVQDVNTDLILRNPEIHLHILRNKAAQWGITPEQIETVLYESYGGPQVSTILTQVDQYPVISEIDPRYQTNPNWLNQLYLKASNGAMIPLNAVTVATEGVGPLSVSHYGQLPAVTIAFNLAPGVSLGNITEKIDSLAQQYMPSDIAGTFVGTAKTFQSALKNLSLLLLCSVLVIYMVLAILYEHFIHPLTILTALPFAAFGALFVLMVFGQELDLFSFIGIIMLVGLVKKNGIILIDFAIAAKREQQLTARNAILAACEVRFRPIMMTTMAAILATLPIALGWGAGSESRRPLGVAIVGGLLFSQLLTLYVTPIFYLTMEKLTARWYGAHA